MRMTTITVICYNDTAFRPYEMSHCSRHRCKTFFTFLDVL